MSTDGKSTALETLSSGITGIPDAVKKPLTQVLSEILGGLTSIPLAKIKQISQGIEDVTLARSAAAARISAIATDSVIEDQALLQAASEIYLPTQLRRAKNRIEVAQRTVAHLASSSENGEKSTETSRKPEAPEADWLNTFLRFAEEASSERLQDMFGRILSGQIVRPSAFSLSTIRTVSELDQGAADDFTHAWSLDVGGSVDYSEEWTRGEGFSRWRRLVEAGLMAPSQTGIYLPPFIEMENGQGYWSPFNTSECWVLAHYTKNSNTVWNHIDFTRIGKEIGSLLAKPNYKENITKAARRLPQPGLTQVEVFESNGSRTMIWQLPMSGN